MSIEQNERPGVVTNIKGLLTLPAVVVAAVILGFIYMHVRSYIAYAGVDVGMSRSELVDHLGEPRRVEQQMIFCAPYFPWTGECVQPLPGGEFLYFKFGIDRWIVTGLDGTGIVWFKTLGDT